MTSFPSNFTFLQPDWPDLLAEARRAEAAAHADPRTACFYARRTLELAVAWLYQAEGGRGGCLRMPYKADLSAFLFEPSFQQLVGNAVHAKMDVIRRLGNQAVHHARPVPPQDALNALRELFHVAFWLAQHYARRVGDRPAAGLQFRGDLLPKPTAIDTTAEQAASRAAQVAAQEALAKQAQALTERDAALREAAARNAALDAELARYRAEIAAAKAANAAQHATAHDYNEATTRDLFIDLLLKEAGWALDQPRDREFEVQGMPNHEGKGFVDYVLWSGERPLALVEAKRTHRSAQEGQQQARLYADCLEKSTGHRPVIYGTNGYEHWMWDDTTSPPRPVQGFHTRDELELMHQRRTTRKPLADLPIAAGIVERHYQHRAIRRIAETFERDQHRKALVVMATGAGKTRTVIALVDLLMRAGWAKRVLFLADRVALVNQAVNAFKAHLPDAAPVNLVTDRATEGRVYVSTYPTMMGLINEGAFKTEYAQSLIDAFAQKDRAPHIAISVDMLDTGIDVPEVVNLVFFKIVRSKAKFWQMVGRGTRLCKDLYGPEQDKKDFFIFDFCQNLEFFSQALEGSEGALAQPLSQRLFNARLELVGLLDQRQQEQRHGVADEARYPLVMTEAVIRHDTVEMLHAMVRGMSLNNFVVRPHRQWVETWSQTEPWKRPTAEQLADVALHLSGLPTSVRDDDEDAKRFDALMLGTQLAMLRQEASLSRLQTKVQQLAANLLELSNVPSVREHLLIIEAIAGDEWWQDVTLPMLEKARRKLRSLIKLIEKSGRKPIYTDFADVVGEATDVELPLVTSAVNFDRFRSKAKVFLRAHESRIALHKLRRNQPLTHADLQELEALLHEAGATPHDIARACTLHTSLPAFVRSLVGLDREAATLAFAHWVTSGTATASQLQFIEEIVQHLTDHGAMPAERLYASPFTDIHAQGPEGIFDSQNVEQLFSALQKLELPKVA